VSVCVCVFLCVCVFVFMYPSVSDVTSPQERPELESERQDLALSSARMHKELLELEGSVLRLLSETQVCLCVCVCVWGVCVCD